MPHVLTPFTVEYVEQSKFIETYYAKDKEDAYRQFYEELKDDDVEATEVTMDYLEIKED